MKRLEVFHNKHFFNVFLPIIHRERNVFNQYLRMY